MSSKNDFFKMVSIFSTSALLIALTAMITLKLSSVDSELDAQIRPPDHIGAYNFTVDIEGVNAGSFRSFEGLSMEVEIIEFQDGDDPILRKRPGRVKYGDITLKKGFVQDDSFQSWIQATITNQIDKRNISIIIKSDDEGQTVRYNLFECFPKSWKISESVGGTVVPVEEITFAVERFERVHE